MILLIEGVNGTGKTTLAQALSKKTGFPIYRPFRTSMTDHTELPDKFRDGLRTMGVPVNTHAEDLYLADFLAHQYQHSPVDLILDRSMPSAVAYGLADNTMPIPGVSVLPAATTLYLVWEERMLATDVLWVHLHASFETVRERSGARAPNRERYNILSKHFNQMLVRTKLERLVLNTDSLTTDQAVDRIDRWRENKAPL